MSTKLSIADRFHRYVYLQKLDLWLVALPSARRRSVLKELKGYLGEMAAEVGMKDAIDELGTPRSVAKDYVDDPVKGPNWVMGALAAILTFFAFAYALMFFSFGMLDALLSSGAASGTGNFLGLTLQATNNASELGVEIQGFSWIWLLAVVLIGLTGARVWRIFKR